MVKVDNYPLRGSRHIENFYKTSSLKPLLGSEFPNNVSCKDGLTSSYFIKLYMKLCRGFSLTHWNRVSKELRRQNCPKDVEKVCYHSWVKFKFARSIRPQHSMMYVYLMKNCSDLDGQKIYDDCFEQYTEQPLETTREFYKNRGRPSIYYRLMEYFYNEDPDWILPLVVFPRIDFEKSKMHYSEIPYEVDQDLLKTVHEKVFNYVMSLGIKSLFMPRGDLMQKYGSQKYNDAGVVRMDYERPSNSFDSSFKYQRFLTQPLTPREVWLPGKAIKQNNAFFMAIHGQILRSDEYYPKVSMEENHSYIKKFLKDGLLKFDISGFGFQYPRELLIAGNNAIRELYPCSELEENSEIFNKILNSVVVEMPDGSYKRPVRGIGLGYYEDLKTIVMMALLRDHHPIQIYGDQGLIEKKGVEFAFELMKYSFIMNYEKVDEGSSEGRLRWGGHIFEENLNIKPKRYSNSIFGAFFSRHHWERKAALYSVYKHYPEAYRSIENRLIFMYHRIFGYEFFSGDVNTPFLNGGISSKPRHVGVQRLFNIRSLMSPVNLLVFDPIYQTPFNLISNESITFKESKIFSNKRKSLWKRNSTRKNDTRLFDYCSPILEYNNKDRPLPRVLPKWADLNLVLFSNMSSGALTSGLRGDDIMDAVIRQSFAPDPFRARATGGYSIATLWRSDRPPSQEWLEAAEVLIDTENSDSLYVNRTDLHQNLMLGEDAMYYNDDLFSNIVKKVGKRKRPTSDNGTLLREELYKDVREKLPSLIKRGKITDFSTIIGASRELLDDYDRGYSIASSEHGQLEDDVSYFADAIDMVDLFV